MFDQPLIRNNNVNCRSNYNKTKDYNHFKNKIEKKYKNEQLKQISKNKDQSSKNR